jgi:penicillin amidase
MFYTKILAQGRLSEFFGKEYVDIDMFVRSLELKKLVDSVYFSTDSETLELLQNFCDGVNCFFESNLQLSVEFDISNIVPEK